MSDWITLKKRAREQHGVLLAAAGGNSSAMALLEAAERVTGIRRIPCPAGDPLLAGAEAVLDLEAGTIWYNHDADPSMTGFYQMHEYAHHWLHDVPCRCSAGHFDAEVAEEETPLGVARVEAYNPRERVEREANVFAREILLPSDALRRSVLGEGATAADVAAKVGVPEGMVHHQISFALLVSDLVVETVGKDPSEAKPLLDNSQGIVAEWGNGPLLVEAGPGTGKTRALVGRVEFLLGKGITPESILALTFSNKAAEEMRSRVAIAAPEAAPRIWMGTFHAFGLELLRKYGSRIGIESNFEVIDPVEAMFLLEKSLPALNLVHYRNLYEPTMYLPDILAAISRAKDELVGPTDYRVLAERMRADADGDEDKALAAEKAIEVSRIYAYYQELIEEKGVLDFGDLIFRSATLLREHSDVREDLRRRYSQFLVDEYQDVNRASGILLRELAGDGAGLWVVGDTRQSVYRFRGAAPTNVRKFPEDFPGAVTRPLGVNYRSRPKIVDVFASLAPRMKATIGRPFTRWKPHRDSTPGEVRMEVAENLDAEAAGIAREILRLEAEGIPFRDQAVLCRSHTTMARVAALLEEAGVPVLYLGDLFEREEIRDLLSLVSLAGGGDGRGLVRVAEFPEYGIPLIDAIALIQAARERNVPFPAALRIANDVEGISEGGKRGLTLLLGHLEDLCYGTSAWGMLVRYLFDRSGYLRPLLADGSLSARQKRLAIHQFLQFAHGQRTRPYAEGTDPKRAFLGYVRRLEVHGDERQLRQVPEWASGLDAVRVLTVHASKGLEFDAVFIPYLGQRYFPVSKRGKVCPPPVGMLPSDMADGAHEEEEECLFFVALSRAREYLCLSRAARYGSQPSNPSDLLSSIAGCLPNSPGGPPTWRIPRPAAVTTTVTPFGKENPAFDVRNLDIYMKCPRKYYYEFVLGLSGKREDAAYVQFHKCVYSVLRWMGEERSKGIIIDPGTAAAKLGEVWAKTGPRDHPYEAIYRESAEGMVTLAVSRTAEAGRPLPSPSWEVPLSSGTVLLTPDFLEEEPGAAGGPTRVLRFRTGRPTDSELKKDIYAVYCTATDRAYRGRGRVKVLYLSTGTTQEVDLKPKTIATRLRHYDEAIAGIRLRQFPPEVSDRECPRCPHYFFCPAGKNT